MSNRKRTKRKIDKIQFYGMFADLMGKDDARPKNILPPSKECERGLDYRWEEEDGRS